MKDLKFLIFLFTIFLKISQGFLLLFLERNIGFWTQA